MRFKIPFMRGEASEKSKVPFKNGDVRDRWAIPLTKILIVDDDEVILKTVKRKLEDVGYRVATAKDGAEAISVARMEKPDLILLDITFPPDVAGIPWDGFRLMEWLNHVNGWKKTPIIIITGDQEMKQKERALAGGAVAFFHKPISHDDLIKVIHATLTSSSST